MAQLNISLPPSKDSHDFDGWLNQVTQYLRDYLGRDDATNVKEYGVVGNGTTDDTIAFQAACTAAETTHRKVIIPANFIIRITSAVTAGAIRIIGESRDTSKIYVDFDGVGITGDGDSISTFEMRNLTMAGSATASTYEGVLPAARTAQVGLKISTTHNSTVKNCMFYNLYTALELKGAGYYNLIEGNKFLTNLVGIKTTILSSDGPSEANIAFNQFYGLAGAVGASVGINIETGSGMKIIGNGFENLYVGIALGANEFISLDRNRFEDNTTHITQDASVYSNTMLGAFGDFDSDDTAPFEGFNKFTGNYFGNFGVRAAHYTTDTTQLVWPLTATNYGNAATTGYGVGLKLKLSTEADATEGAKWAGVVAIAGQNNANRTDLGFYAKALSGTNVEVGRFIANVAPNGPYLGIGTTNPVGFELALGGLESRGGLYTQAKYISKAITADASIVMAFQIPLGAKLLFCQLRVVSALVAGETWDSAYSTGSTQAIATASAVAISTRVNKFFDAHAATDITTDLTDITITKNGGGAFSAQGVIDGVVYYQFFTVMQ